MAVNSETASASGRSLGSGRALGGRGGPTYELAAPPPPPAPALSLNEARAQSQTAATAQELGDLFEYKLQDPVTIAKNRSALVTIVQPEFRS